ncbi:hypothetical protein L204_105943 [Cryptococcus depauperatus]|nr:hypothetical protein L204_05066 [Cryptococcus depauperatus CBS 7855]
MSNPSSVRSLYAPPPEEWVFLPPTVMPPTSAPSAPPTHLPSPFIPDTDLSSKYDDQMLLPGFGKPINLFIGEFLTTAMGMPFEVGKTLLQVEYRPRRQFAMQQQEMLGIADPNVVLEDDMEQSAPTKQEDELSNPEEAELYFTDRLAQSTLLTVPAVAPPMETDASGYLPDSRPMWLLKDDPDISRGNGVWGMIRRIRYTPSEGLPALWKSQFISTFHSFLTNALQPSIHSFLLLLSPSPIALAGDTPLTALPDPRLPLAFQVGSHLLTHFLLSPLETIRTRLIVLPTHPSSPSSLSLFHSMLNEEGGWQGMYWHPNLLFPAVLEHTLRPLFALSTPLLLERCLGLSPEVSPILYSLADLSLGLAHLLVLLPIETVRRRLQIQYRFSSSVGRSDEHSSQHHSHSHKQQRLKTVVKTREKDYVGIVEALWRITTEETSVRMTKREKGEDGSWFAGVRQLYRGFGMAATAHATVFGLGLISAVLSKSDGGWKEI